MPKIQMLGLWYHIPFLHLLPIYSFPSFGYRSTTTTAGISSSWQAPVFTIFAHFPKVVSFPKNGYLIFKVRTGNHFQPATFSAVALRSSHCAHFTTIGNVYQALSDNCNQIVTTWQTFNKVPSLLYICIRIFSLSLYGVHFRPFCITIIYVNALYGVFRRS